MTTPNTFEIIRKIDGHTIEVTARYYGDRDRWMVTVYANDPERKSPIDVRDCWSVWEEMGYMIDIALDFVRTSEEAS